MNDIEKNLISAAKSYMQFFEFHLEQKDSDAAINSYYGVSALTDLEKAVDNGLSAEAESRLRDIGAKALDLFVNLTSNASKQ